MGPINLFYLCRHVRPYSFLHTPTQALSATVYNLSPLSLSLSLTPKVLCSAPASLLVFMAVFLFLLALSMAPSPSCHAEFVPAPGYTPSSKFRPTGFYEGYRNLWGPQHQNLDQNALTIWLDRSSGSGFKSVRPFRSGYFGANIKLQPGYTAGVITSFYLSNNEAHPGHHDEVDIEFLGTTFGKPYTLQTNVYIAGTGDGKIIGREMKFHLWFDPTQSFHHYAILWRPDEIIFLVDDVPIRRYPRSSRETFPLRPMWVYGSIWDASSWATEDGKYRVDYRYEPFVAKYSSFIASGCSAYAPIRCQHPSASPSRSGGLTGQQYQAMQWVQTHHMVYHYCWDPKRDHSLTPECWRFKN